MKIALVCFNLSWQAGGVRLIYSQTRALVAEGHQVTIYAPDLDTSVYPELRRGLDIRVIQSGAKPLWQYASQNLFRRVIEKWRHTVALTEVARAIAEKIDLDFDIVNLHDFAYILGRFYRRRGGQAKIIWTMNEPPYQYLPKESFLYDVLSRAYNFFKDFSERKYFGKIDGAAVLVARYKEWAEKRGMRAKVIRSGLDFDKFYSSPKSVAHKKQFEVLSLGALNRYRRFEDTVRATKALRHKGYDARVKIIAKNIWREDRYEKEFTDFVAREGMGKFTTLNFHGVSESDLPRVYAQADFFILPMYLPPPRSGYGWQMVGFEAMAAGTPTVVCRALDVTEALEDGKTALFTDPMNFEQIAARIEALIKKPELYVRIARQGQEFVRNNLSWEKYARELLAFSETLERRA